jgi:hypothetical protein
MGRTALLLALCLGCVSAKATTPEGEAHEARPVGYPIAVFVGDDAPKSVRRAFGGIAEEGPIPEHDEIGRIELKTGAVASWATVALSGREEARRLGGDAIEVLDFDDDDEVRILSARVLRYR